MAETGEQQNACSCDPRRLHTGLFFKLSTGVVYHSPDGAIRDANGAAERILGLSRDQLQGRSSVDPRWRAVHEDFSEFPGQDHPAMRVLADGQPVHGVTMGVFNPEQDDYRWILIDADPVAVAEETWVVATFTDITDLRASHEVSRALLESIDQHTIVSMTDLAGTITYANDAFCELSGYSRDELLGRNHRIVRSGHHPPEFYDELWSTISSGRGWRGEICNLAKDGSVYWVAASISPLSDMLGKTTGYVSVRTDITAQKTAEAEAENRSREDPLTGLANRRHFDERLRYMLAEAAIAGEPLALVIIDLDRFKTINDRFGHDAGDVVLTSFANFLTDHVSDADGLVARWGGEEFAVLLKGLDRDSAGAWLDRLMQALRETCLSGDGTLVGCGAGQLAPGSITMSAGLAVAPPGSAITPEDLVRLGDSLMYEAKRAGRNRWVGPDGP